MIEENCSVLIVGAGPSGLLLSQLLYQSGIDNIIVERTTKERVMSRIRAGVLERGTVDAMTEAGCESRLSEERIDHDGLILSFDGDSFEVPVKAITGHYVTVYGQTEITFDLIEACEERGQAIYWDSPDTKLYGLESNTPTACFTNENGQSVEISAQLIAGCDGFHGVSRQSMPSEKARQFERVYPFGWLGVLVDQPPVAKNVVYANHQDGFALASMRSETRSRYYVQTQPGESLDDWPIDKFWSTFKKRLGVLGEGVITGEPLEMSIAPLRSFVAQQMRFGRLFLAGDAAHIVPPTGAKGLNLAIADVRRLARAIKAWNNDDESGLENYSRDALDRVWKVERFSWYLTNLVHQFDEHNEFEKKIQRAEFDYVRSSEVAQAMVAENYVGLDF